jgi:hypothetical protein
MAVRALVAAFCALCVLHSTHGARHLQQAPVADAPLQSFLTCKKAEFADYATPSWNDKGSGANIDFGTYQVEDKSSTSSPYKSLSYFGFAIKSNPRYDLRTFLNNNQGVRNAILCAPSKPILFKNPLSYAQVWNDGGSGADQDGAIWRPQPPRGYKCLGDVWTIGYSPPDLKAITCVADEVVENCASGGTVWTDAGSGARQNLALKYANQMLSTDPPIGTGFQRGNVDDKDFFCIKKSALRTEYISSVNILNITTISLANSDISSLQTARDYLGEQDFDNPTAGSTKQTYRKAWTKETSATLEFERELTIGFGTSTEITVGYEPAAIGGLKTEFKQAFTWKRDLRENTKSISTQSQTQTYEVTQEVNVPPFVSLVANAYVDYSNDVQVPVDAYFLIQAKDTVTGDTLTKAEQATFESLLIANGFDGTVTGYDAAKQSFIVQAKAKIKTSLGIRSGVSLKCKAPTATNPNTACNPSAEQKAAVPVVPLVAAAATSPAPASSPAPAPATSPATAGAANCSAAAYNITGCDADTKTITCDCGVISITKATWGGATDNKCATSGAPPCTDPAKVTDVTAAVNVKCQDAKTCDVKIYPAADPFNGSFGAAEDKCEFQAKQAVIEYKCVTPTAGSG